MTSRTITLMTQASRVFHPTFQFFLNYKIKLKQSSNHFVIPMQALLAPYAYAPRLKAFAFRSCNVCHVRICPPPYKKVNAIEFFQSSSLKLRG